MRRWWMLLMLGACTAENPSEAPDDPPVADAQIGDDAAMDAALPDAAPDAARPDPDAARDMAPDQAVDMTPDPMPDMAPDLATPDAGPPDASPPDLGPDADPCTPADETCDGLDQDCDGRIDEGFGVGAPCAAGVGACAGEGVVRCDADGGAICVGEPIEPGVETCNGVDDDCDGTTDEAIPAEPCYAGPPETLDVGACRGGQTACAAGAVICVEQVRPRAELCDGADADCDGIVDEGCAECGNGALDPGEACDDGNRDAGDGCAPNCRLESASDALIPGVQRDVPIASLADRGFFPCYTGTYNRGGEPLDGVLSACQGTDLLIGCRPTGGDTLTVAAEGRYDEVTRDVGGGQGAVNPHNGVHFYFSRAASWGFAPFGAGVNRNTCDVAAQDDPDRMCWHTQNDAFRGGWRCGTTTRLNASGDWERVIFARTAVALGAQRGFGHHGECDSFNGCADAETCAEAACALEGHGPPLSWRSGGCEDVPGLDCDLFSSLPDDLDTDWAGGCNIPVAYDVVCSGGAPPQCGDGVVEGDEECDDGNREAGDGCSPRCTEEEVIEILFGPQTNVPIGGLNLGGFEICHTETYATRFNPAAVRAECPGATWIVGCRPVGGGDLLTVAAMGLQETIFDPVPNEAGAVREHNQSNWYFGENFSFGFAPADAQVSRRPCDTAGDRPELRLCWHTINAGGWRCGATTGLNDSQAWERVILQTMP